MRGKPIPYDAPPKLVPSDRRPDFDATFAQRRYAETNFPGAAMSEPVVGAPLLIHGASSAMSHGGADAAEGVVAVPSPSQGGKPGRANALAWSQGMAPTGTLTPRFGRRFMHVPYQRVHPVAGPVGFDKRTSVMQAQLTSQYAQLMATPRQVATMFAEPASSGYNPVLASWE